MLFAHALGGNLPLTQLATFMQRGNWKTPYELLYNKKPDLAYFRTFRCLAYVFKTDEQRKDKLTPKPEAMTFISYRPSIKTYLLSQLTFLAAVARLTAAVPTGNLSDAVHDLNKTFRTRSLVDYESSRQSSIATTVQPSLETNEEERQEEEVRAQSPDSDRNMEPSILSVLDGGDIVGWTVAATALSLMNDEEFKKTILEQNKIDAAGQPTNPCLISVFDGYQKVCNTLMMKDPPTHWDLKMNFREFNILPPNEFEVQALADPILNNYGIKEDPKIFDRVYLLMVLMSNYLFAHTLVHVAKQCYYDMSFHFTQILINYMRMNPTYIYDRAQLMFVFDVAFHFIQTGGDKYIKNAPAKEFGILHLCPINLPRERLEVIMDNIHLYTQRVHEDGTIHVDAMAYFPEYVKTVQRLIILGVEIEGIDRPETILANRSIGDDVHLKAKGEEFTLSPGNVTRGHGEQ
ncbi:hypothetical protein M378DRAFT_18159 [Amanita muscaria Koide BX008]|uniref:Uncharacterized protein n=1 Tax=Amanita muscaria (strain Koide BX008) TaxID=946122 RepID=A0A0C2WF27_AMAMK|nr:hypothetical protein M378DRAFT_18159 [Amanita muscaria Koide BX008]